MGIYRIIVLDYSGKSKYYDPLKEILTIIIINHIKSSIGIFTLGKACKTLNALTGN